MFLFIQVPFTRSVKQIVGVFQIENLLPGRIAREGRAEHRVCAMEQLGTFRILGDEFCSTAVHLNFFQSQDAFGPGDHQMDFNILDVLDILDVVRRNIKGAARRVHLRKAHEIVVKAARTLVICGNHVGEACANGLLSVYVQLAETAFDAFGLPDTIRLIVNGPTGNRHTAGNKRLFAIVGFVTHVMAILTAVAFIEPDSSGQSVGTLAENDFDIARHGTVDCTYGLLCLRNRLEGFLFSSLVRIAARGSYVEGCLRRSKRHAGHNQT